MKTVAIMQPTFMPWLGYFALMDAADNFIYLDDVQYSKQSWQTRNRIKSSQGELMLSLAISRQSTKSSIKDVRLAAKNNHVKLMKSLKGNLGKAPYFELAESIIEQSYVESEGYLAKFTMGIANRMADVSGITTERHIASELPINSMDKNSRLLAFCEYLSADSYLSPIGSYAYLSECNPFHDSPIQLSFQNYSHPEYPQAYGEFLPYMAGIDAFAWVGPERFLSLIRSGNDAPFAIEQLDFMQAA